MPPRKADEMTVQLLRLDATTQGLVVGTLAALGVFVATNWLVFKGGPVVGPHLALLAQYFPGYTVTFAGSLVGAAWAFGWGFAAGFFVATLYDRLAVRRARRRAGSGL
jgi:hypothetical protein